MITIGNKLASVIASVRHRKVKQVGSLYLSIFIGIIVGIAVSVTNTRLLGPEQYGDFKFLINLFAFTLTLLSFGFFATGARLVARNDLRERRKSFMGALMILVVSISVIMSISLFIFSYFQNDIFSNNLGKYIRYFSPLLFVFPFKKFLSLTLQGDNRIYDLSIFNIGPQIIYLLTALSLNYFIPLTLPRALLLNMSTLAFFILIFSYRLRPKFTEFKNSLSIIFKANRSHGFQVYLGAMAGVASAQLSAIVIGYFAGNVDVGYFGLALSITQPLALIPNAVAITFYRDFTDLFAIPTKVALITVLISLFSLAVFLMMIKYLFLFLYSEKFIEALPLVYILAFGTLAYGLGDFLNKFIQAHGIGRFVRNTAIAVGLINLIGIGLLIKYFGATGAALTNILAAVTYLSLMFLSYRKTKSLLASNRARKNRI